MEYCSARFCPRQETCIEECYKITTISVDT